MNRKAQKRARDEARRTLRADLDRADYEMRKADAKRRERQRIDASIRASEEAARNRVEREARLAREREEQNKRNRELAEHVSAERKAREEKEKAERLARLADKLGGPEALVDLVERANAGDEEAAKKIGDAIDEIQRPTRPVANVAGSGMLQMFSILFAAGDLQ